MADKYIERLGDGEHASKFYEKDAAFKKHHVYMLQKRNLRLNYPALMIDLNTADKKAVANVAALLQADKKAGAKATKVLMKKNKVTRKMPDVIKMFKKTFKISA